MADYKELLRRAISALPENNGAARRAVYEKARSALVGQLRAIQPPLPAREITQHRLQLEDCIRQVEQEASEAVISLGREAMLAAKPIAPAPLIAQAPANPEPKSVVTEPVEPVFVAPSAPAAPVQAPPLAPEKSAREPNASVARAPQPDIKPEPPAPKEPAAAETPKHDPLSIEAIIGEAASAVGAKVEPVAPEPGPKAPDIRTKPDL